MTVRALLAFLAAAACALPAAGAATATVPVAAARPPATGPVIRSITLSPAAPVVRPGSAVRLVIDVVARGVSGPDGVTIQVEPGAVPGTDAPAGRGSGDSRTASGRVAVPRVEGAPVRLGRTGAEWETWRFLPERRLNRRYPAGRWTITATARGAEGATAVRYAEFWLKRATVLTSVQVVRGEGGVRVGGVLRRVDPQGYTDYAPFAGQPVEILYRRDGEEAWGRVAGAVTDRLGYFVRKVEGHRRGDWRVRFPGTGRFAADSSRVLRVDKRDN
ncbi:hypothetical protein HS041_35190 [Planomonospora sp. ID67723]|uniref:hypothetical protein n=1 Tax=Planomonospora sp. ID67723 TaxID=2738134 RepID=UPI0018C37673|nr:hypothetical protein [Planomonospora sp. ID67723]MBG0832949.1 hypothetical protein [Planomonospora sp. ID67723]